LKILSTLSNEAPGASIALKIFFGLQRCCWFRLVLSYSLPRQAFRVQGPEGATYASANLRLAMLVLIWIHAIMMNTSW